MDTKRSRDSSSNNISGLVSSRNNVSLTLLWSCSSRNGNEKWQLYLLWLFIIFNLFWRETFSSAFYNKGSDNWIRKTSSLCLCAESMMLSRFGHLLEKRTEIITKIFSSKCTAGRKTFFVQVSLDVISFVQLKRKDSDNDDNKSVYDEFHSLSPGKVIPLQVFRTVQHHLHDYQHMTERQK